MSPILEKLSSILLSLTLLLSSSIASIPSTSQVAQVVSAPTSGLVAYWNFDQGSGTTATDSSGSGNNATFNGGASWTTGKVGGGSVNLDGVNGVVIPTSDPVATNTVTMCAWVNPRNVSIWTQILSNGNTIFSIYSNGKVLVSSRGGGSPTISSASTIPTNQWSHICVIRQSDGTGSIYINGTQSGTSGSAGVPLSGYGLGIGDRGYGITTPFNGIIDEVRIYNRILSASEISDVYNSGSVSSPSDTTAPSTPASLSATAVSSSAINLTWSASTDNVGVTGYKIYRGGTQIGTSATNSYSDTGLSANTSYSYTVSAYDQAGNTSAQSSSVSATTQSVSVSAPSITSFSASPTSITSGQSSTLSWNTTGATTLSISSIGTVTGTTRSVSPTQTTTYTLTATNSSGSVTANTTVTVSTAIPDTTAPSVPTGLSATAISSSQINLSWTASTDNIAVTGYKIYRNGTQVGTSATNSYSDTSLSPSTTYTYTVSAYDGAGNTSSQSSSVSGTTQAQAPAGSLIGGILDPSRAIDWSKAGVVGGIPSASWTQCGSTISAGATLSTIQTAINNCGTNQYVKLGPGTFNLTSGILMKSNMVLRGSGADQTSLVFTGADGCAGAWSVICFLGADSSDWSGSSSVAPGGPQAASWTGGYTQGTTQIVLNNIGSNGIKVGQYIYLDQDNDTSPTNGFFTCEETTTGCSVEGGKGNPGRVVGGIARQQLQIVKVTGCSPSCTNGATFTISPGLYAPNWSASKNPGAWWSKAMIQNSGIEDVSVDQTNSTGQVGVSTFSAANIWIKGTRQIRTCQCSRSIVQITESTHVTVQDNYIYGTSGHSTNYGVEAYGASDLLVVNNIFQHTVSPMMIHANTGSAYLYNYTINDSYDDGRLPMYHWMAASIGGHSGGVMYNLFEGNIGPGLGSDYIHGNQMANTMFRNYWLGSDPGRIDNANTIRIDAWNRYWNVVGNVLGTPGYTITYTGGNKAIYDLGSDYTPVPFDALVATTMMRWGNYDTVNASTRWVTSEVPSGLSQLGNAVPSSQTLPASLFYSSKPSWWPSGKAWPPIGPDVSGGNISGLAGHVYSIPAKDCYLNTMGGPADGNGSILTFNASSCYGSGGSTTPPPSDSVAPSVPSSLVATAISSSAINLSWTASTDNTAVTGYKIYRAGTQVGTSATNSYSDSGLTPSTAYSYTVSAYDAAGNNSSQSTSASATTQSLLPTISNLVGSSITTSGATISWSTNIPTNGQVSYGSTSAYGSQSALLDNTTKTTTHTTALTGLSSNTTYNFKVTSVDALGNSVSSTNFTFTTLTPALPPAPTISSFSASPASIQSGNSSTLSWSTTGATTLSISSIGTVTGTTRSVSPTQTTTYTLTATNSGGSSSAQTTVTVSAVTPPPATTTAPSITSFSANPSSLLAGSQTVLTWTTTGTPTPSISISPSIGTLLGSSHTFTPSQSGTYTLTATNSAGSATAQVSLTVTQPSVTPPSTGGGGGGSSAPIIITTGGGGGTTGNVLSASIQFIPPSTTGTTTPTQTTTLPPLTRTLKLGMKGTDVTTLQTFLIAKGYLAPNNTTGYFGNLTQSAVKAFQKANNIVSSGSPATTGYGMVGIKTRTAINAQLNTVQANTTTSTTTPQTSTAQTLADLLKQVADLQAKLKGR